MMGIRDIVNCHDSHKAAAMHPQKSVPDLLLDLPKRHRRPIHLVSQHMDNLRIFHFIRTYVSPYSLQSDRFPLYETIVMYLSSGMKQFLRKIIYFIEAFISEYMKLDFTAESILPARWKPNLDF